MSFHNPILNGNSGEWTPPDDWLDISDVAHNEIQFLATDQGQGITFICTIASGGTYNIDWGDGTIETGRASATAYGHLYAVGTGTEVADGFTIFKGRIYTDGNDLQRIQFYVSNLLPDGSSNNTEKHSCLLSLAIDGSHFTAFNVMFDNSLTTPFLKSILIKSWGTATNASYLCYGRSYLEKVTLPSSWGTITDCSYMFANCNIIEKITIPSSWGSVTTAYMMFYYCLQLKSITLPNSWGSITDTRSMFHYCQSLPSIVLPSSWATGMTSLQSMFAYCTQMTTYSLPSSWSNITSTQGMFQYNILLSKIILPNSWGSITNVSSMFEACWVLIRITLPNASNSIIFASAMFGVCYSIITIDYLDTIGSTTNDADLYGIHNTGYRLTGDLSFGAKLSRFGIDGSSVDALLKITSLRLTNANSTFGGSSPQIQVQYTELDVADLEALFGDIPNGLATGKRANIAGNTGSPTLISKTVGITSGSAAVTCANTSSLATGMEVYGTGLSLDRAVTFQDAGDTVTLNNHGIPNGKIVSFTSITTTTGITKSTAYYVVNAGTNTFQLEATIGGGALPLTTNGSGNLRVVPTIQTINTNVSIILDVPASANGTSLSAGILKRSILIHKGFTTVSG